MLHILSKTLAGSCHVPSTTLLAAQKPYRHLLVGCGCSRTQRQLRTTQLHEIRREETPRSSVTIGFARKQQTACTPKATLPKHQDTAAPPPRQAMPCLAREKSALTGTNSWRFTPAPTLLCTAAIPWSSRDNFPRKAHTSNHSPPPGNEDGPRTHYRCNPP